jgi:hypothetical protein
MHAIILCIIYSINRTYFFADIYKQQRTTLVPSQLCAGGEKGKLFQKVQVFPTFEVMVRYMF